MNCFSFMTPRRIAGEFESTFDIASEVRPLDLRITLTKGIGESLRDSLMSRGCKRL